MTLALEYILWILASLLVIVGPFIGAFAGELLMRPNLKQAGKSGLGAWLGIVIGGAVKASIAIAMIGIFVAAYFL